MSTRGNKHEKKTIHREDPRVMDFSSTDHAVGSAARFAKGQAAQANAGGLPRVGVMPCEAAERGEGYSPGIDHLPVLSSDAVEALEQDCTNCTRNPADLSGTARNIHALMAMDVTDGEFVYRLLEKHPDNSRKISSIALRYCRLLWNAFTGRPRFVCVEQSDNGVFSGANVKYEVTVMPSYGAGFILSRKHMSATNWEWTGLRLIRALLASAGFVATELDAVGRLERWGVDESELREITADDVTDEQFFEAGEESGIGILEDKGEAKRLLVEIETLSEFDPYLNGTFSSATLSAELLRWVEQSEWISDANSDLLRAARKLCAVIAEDKLAPVNRADGDFYPDGLEEFCMTAFMVGDFPVLGRLINQMENDMLNAGETPGVVIGANTPDELRAQILRFDRWAAATVVAIEAVNSLMLAEDDDEGILDA